ncbi:MAG TPA: RluA family pseudouridine synthase [Thermodesulfobacteriota bacterium]
MVRELIVPEGGGGRLDHVLVRADLGLPRAQIGRLIDEGRVTVNGKPAGKPGQRVRPGDRLSVSIPPPAPVEARAEAIPLSIVYEDEDLLVVDKPAGLVVHPAAGHPGGTLVNAILHHTGPLDDAGDPLRPGIVHRLDKDTSGLLVVTKTAAAREALAARFKAHDVERVYTALVHGVPAGGRGRIESAIGRHPTDRRRMSSRARRGRRAVTHYEVVRTFPGPLALLAVRLETGRTHQIRVHLSERGHPVVGDRTYGGRRPPPAALPEAARRAIAGLSRQFLHAGVLGFRHPRTGQAMRFTSPLPADLAAVLDALDAAR